MRVAILSESSADEAALRIIVNYILQIETQLIELNLRSRGWPAVNNIVPAMIKQLHYYSEAEHLIVVADSNHSSIQGSGERNRLQSLQFSVERTVSILRPIQSKQKIRVAAGIACPCIEAWLLATQHPHITEQAWEDGLRDNREPYSKLQLKKMLYGTDRPNLQIETSRMTEAANLMCRNIINIEKRFPRGFGTFAREIRSWGAVSG